VLVVAGDRDEREVRQRIERRLAVEARVHREGGAQRHDERVPVGGSLGDELGTDIAGRARPRLHQKDLLETKRELIRQRTSDEIEWSCPGCPR
jgi:hypothetical protein